MWHTTPSGGHPAQARVLVFDDPSGSGRSAAAADRSASCTSVIVSITLSIHAKAEFWPGMSPEVVVALPRRPIRLGDNLTVGVGDRADAADMVDVALREDDVADGRRVDGVVVGAVHRSLEAHPRVQHDPAFVGRQHVRVRQSRATSRCLGDLFRGRTRADDVVGPRAAQVGGFVNRSYFLFHVETVEVEAEPGPDFLRGPTEVALEVVAHLAVLAARVVVEVAERSAARASAGHSVPL